MLMIKKSCNFIEPEVQLITPSQHCCSQILPSIDDYLQVKNLRPLLISSRYIDDKTILQSDWLRAFWVITVEQDFSQKCSFYRIISNIIINHCLHLCVWFLMFFQLKQMRLFESTQLLMYSSLKTLNSIKKLVNLLWWN